MSRAPVAVGLCSVLCICAYFWRLLVDDAAQNERFRLHMSVPPPEVEPVRSMPRDCELRGLMELLNDFDWTSVVNKSGISPLLEHLSPWIVGDHTGGAASAEAAEAARPQPPEVVCGARKYRTALTGALLPRGGGGDGSRVIVDLVPFGYNLDYLELRLLEYGDLVDLFVVSEAPWTHLGVRKPTYFELAKRQRRFARWSHKILHVRRRAEEQPGGAVEGLLGKLGQAEGGHLPQESWALEYDIRDFPVGLLGWLLKAVDVAQCDERDAPEGDGAWRMPSAALCRVARGLEDALILQNDEDEIMTRRAVLHLKRCELRAEALRGSVGISAPATFFKRSARWLSGVAEDLKCLQSEIPQAQGFTSYLWRPGPFAVSLKQVLGGAPIGRSRYEGSACRNGHLGVGSASHFSSNWEPSLALLKAVGVIDAVSDVRGILSVLAAAAGGRGVDLELLMRALYGDFLHADTSRPRDFDWCEAGQRHKMRNTARLSESERAIWLESLPWALKSLPGRFCFLMPDYAAGPLKLAGSADVCQGEPSSS